MEGSLNRWEKQVMDSQRSKGMSWADEDACWDSKNGRKSPWQQARSIWSVSKAKNRIKSHAQVCRTGLADLPRNTEFRGSSASAFIVPPRASPAILNSARAPRRLTILANFCVDAVLARNLGFREDPANTQPLATSVVSARFSRGPSPSASRPRSHKFWPSLPSSAGCVAGFLPPRELRGGSGW